MGLKTASEITRLGKKYNGQDVKAKLNNPKIGVLTAARNAGIKRAPKKK